MKLKIYCLGFLLMIGACQNQTAEKPETAEKTALQNLKDVITKGEYPQTNAILISQNDELVFEEYFNKYDQNSTQDVRSTTKSITALLAGIALDKGFIKSFDDPIFNYLSQYNKDNIKNWNDQKASITVADLLTMRTGIGCEQFFGDMGFPDCEDKMFDEHDWVKYGLDQAMAFEPGKQLLYTGTAPMIMGAVISEASGMGVDEFAAKYLFEPLGIKKGFRWTKNKNTGRVFTAGNFYVTPRNMLKIGELVMHKGVDNGKTIIAQKTIEEITARKIIIPNEYSFFKTAGDTWEGQKAAEYGYYWYTENVKVGDRELTLQFTFGNGGNYIVLAPELNNLVIVFTGSNYGKPIINKQPFDMMYKYIIPHFIKKTV